MLKGALGKLISGGGSSGNDASFNLETPFGRLSAFFREIENTTAQRRLTLTIGEAQMTFDLGNKKVFRFIEVVPDSDGRGRIAAGIQRDYDQLDGQLKLLAELLTAFVARGGKFDMVSRPSPVSYPAKTDGFPAAEWRFACDLYGVVPAAAVPEVARIAAPPVPEEPVVEEEEEEEEEDNLMEMRLPMDIQRQSPMPSAMRIQPAVREPELVAAAPSPKPVAAPVAPAPAPQPVFAASPAEEDTISSIMVALGNSGLSMPDVLPAPAAVHAPAPVAARAAAPQPAQDPAIVEKFYEAVVKYCDLAMMITEEGHVLEFTDSAAGWCDLGPDVAKDMKAWVAETAKLMPGSQLVMMRSPILQNQSVIFMTNGKLTAFGAFSSHVTGRIFSIANDFVGKKR
jgi:hypothetical protein